MSLVREKEVAYVIVLTDSINNISYTRGVGAVSALCLGGAQLLAREGICACSAGYFAL